MAVFVLGLIFIVTSVVIHFAVIIARGDGKGVQKNEIGLTYFVSLVVSLALWWLIYDPHSGRSGEVGREAGCVGASYRGGASADC